MTRVADLSGALLDYWVAKGTGMLRMIEGSVEEQLGGYSPSANWAQGGPIIDRKGITIVKYGDFWSAYDSNKNYGHGYGNTYIDVDDYVGMKGSTALEAAMRCCVESAFGEEVPD